MRGSIVAVHHCSHSAAAPLLLQSAALSSCGLILLALLLIRAHLIHAYMEIVGQAVAGAPATPPRPQRSPLAERAAELLHKRCKVRHIHVQRWWGMRRLACPLSWAPTATASGCTQPVPVVVAGWALFRPGPTLHWLQIRVKDGRVLVGDFTCLDRQGNIILTNTYEVMMLNGR